MLRVLIQSFSYLQGGYPSDTTGHGGGFVFDCRHIENPGRYDQFRLQTGLDKPVVEFLEGREDVKEFLVSVQTLASAAVRNALKRGFTTLSFSFGCTGGQHRSVYFAEKLACFLQEGFLVEAQVTHRERVRGNWKWVEPRYTRMFDILTPLTKEAVNVSYDSCSPLTFEVAGQGVTRVLVEKLHTEEGDAWFFEGHCFEGGQKGCEYQANYYIATSNRYPGAIRFRLN